MNEVDGKMFLENKVIFFSGADQPVRRKTLSTHIKVNQNGFIICKDVDGAAIKI